MAKRRKKKKRGDEAQPAVRIVTTVIPTHEQAAVTLVPGVTDEDPNTGRRIEKRPKK
jgi:hypothetical protein